MFPPDLSECSLSLSTAMLGCLARPLSRVKAPSSISFLGAEGEACLEVPAEEIRMSCFFLPP